MTPARWQQVKETLALAMERNTTAERASFLSQACDGDTALRREVDSLLGQAGGAIDSWADAGGFIGADPALVQDEGRRIGAYKLVRELGRGGMGTVWLATRADDEFQKTVAIKLLKRGTDTDEVLRRFRAEREILARLEHPNIARLLDGGTTDEGLPYFVMEYVEGTQLTTFVVERQLSLAKRIQLFQKICAAVQFAHQNLIIHRDLKPANILITAESEPKLLDFGIAKLLAPTSEAWEATMVGRERLTPAYASPEQILGDPVTTVSDVYSLGSLLYETLCERPPHSFSKDSPTQTELIQVVCEATPARPSIAARTPEMRRSLRGDLETIILRAMSREPARRYPGASQLADDLRRYAEGWPVKARRDTFGYRLGKFVKRNKIGVAVAVVIVVGSVLTVVEARKAERERVRADQRFNEVRKLAHAVLFDYHDQIAALPGSTQVREKLVKDALDYLDRLSRDPANDKALERELAAAYEKVGHIQGNAYYGNLGDTEAALLSYRKSLAIRQRLYSANPTDPETSFELAQSYEGLGDILNTKEDLPGGLAAYQSALPFLETISASSPADLDYLLTLAQLYTKVGDIQGMEGYANLGDTAGALVSYRKAESLLDRLFSAHPDNKAVKSKLANALSHLGSLADNAGDIRAAADAGRRSISLLQELAATDANNQSYRIGLLVSTAFLRNTLVDDNQLAEAISNSKSTISALQVMSETDPKNAQLRRSLAVTHNVLGRDLLSEGDALAAAAEHKTALVFFEEKLASSPESEDTKSDLAFTEARLGEAQAALGNQAAALESYNKALNLRGAKQVLQSSNAKEQQNLSLVYADLAEAHAAEGALDEAMTNMGQAISLAEKLAISAPSNAKWRAALALRYSEFGLLRQRLAKDRQDGCDSFARGLSIWRELQKHGTLLPIYHDKPAEVRQEMERCNCASN